MGSEKLAGRLAAVVTLVFVALGASAVLDSRQAEGAVTAAEARSEVDRLVDRALAHDAHGVCRAAQHREACLHQLEASVEETGVWPTAVPQVQSVTATPEGQRVLMVWRDQAGAEKRAEMVVMRRGKAGVVVAGPVFWVVATDA